MRKDIPKYFSKLSKKCFIVAELSANHNGKLSNLLKMMRKAKSAGADAVKIQAYEADGITMKSNKKYFRLQSKSKWKKYNNLYNLYKKAQTPKRWYKKIFDYAKKIEIKVFASVFDLETLKFLEKNVNCQIYKIASPEIIDIPLLKEVAKTGKTVIVSNGLANFDDLKLAVKTITKYHKNFVILKCTSSYPAPTESLNLSTINDIRKKFKCPVGFSDHTEGIDSAIFSAAIGAKILEKHVVLKKNSNTVDGFFSIDFQQFKTMVETIRKNENSLGKISYTIPNSSLVNMHGRKSIFVSKEIKKGEKFNKDNIKVIRPYHGLHPKFYNYLINKISNKNLFAGDPLKMSDVKK